MTLFKNLLDDEHGFIITTELVIVATLLVIGLIAGIQCLQTAVVSELKDVGAAIGSLNQSYSYTGKHGCWAWGCCGHTSCTAGSAFYDSVDEYREDYEFGCISQQSSTVIQHHENEPVPTPADEAVCPPETVITPDAPVLNPTIAPEVCPPDQECPPATDCQDCPQEQSCQGCQQGQISPDTNCTDCEQEQQF